MTARRKPDRSTVARNTSYVRAPKPVELETVTVATGAVVTVGSDVMVDTKGYGLCSARVFRIYKNSERDEEVLLEVYWYYIPEHTKKKRQKYHAENEIFSSEHPDSVPADSVLWTCAVLPMDKYVAYRNFMNRREGIPELSGPVDPDPHFSPAVDLAPCRDLCQEVEPAQRDGLHRSRKGKRSEEDGDGNADTDGTKDSVESGENRVRNGDYPRTRNGKGPVLEEEESSAQEAEEEDFEEHNRVYLCRGDDKGGKYDYYEGGWKDCEVVIYCLCDRPYNPDKQMIQCPSCTEWVHEECALARSQIWKNFVNGRTSICGRCQAQRLQGEDEDSDDFEEN